LLTPRGWWFLFVSLILCAGGAWLSESAGDGIAVIGFTLLAWFLWEWIQFAYRFYFVLPKLIVHRELRDERKVVPILWADGEFDVHVRVSIGERGDLPYVVLADWVAVDGKLIDGSEELITAIYPEHPATIRYRLSCPRPGELRFEGVRIRIADRQGFFYHRTLIKEESKYLVLPRLTGAEGNRRGAKRHNIFPPPGVHRLKRPGGGSELLDLRDYIAGDPPKMIAWKPSARKDKLFTKEFESEVPVRCTLFVDTSESTRVGSRRTKITRLANLAAGVAEAVVADRDHAGLVVFDEQDSQVMRPKRSRRHVIDMLHLLARAAGRTTPIGPFADANTLGRLAYPLAGELYPEMMSKRVNTAPWRMFWSPPSDYRRGWWVLAFFALLIVVAANYLARQIGFVMGYRSLAINSFGISQWWYERFGGFHFRIMGQPIVILRVWFVALGLAAIGMLIWLLHGLSGHIEPWRSERLRRKQLGLLFATFDGAPPGTESHYLHDDQIFARRAQRFLADHHARYPVRLYDARGRYLFHSRPKLDVLIKALNYGVARGRDNELFVLLVDLIDLVDDLDHLIRAVRVAVARHHQVIVILPWQEDVPEPPREAPGDDDRIRTRKAERFGTGGYRALADEIAQDFVESYHKAYFRLRREFGRLGVLVVRADHEEPVHIILDRLDRLRGVGRRR
jgi:uncharacterized protein (DUF58 family)